MEAVVSTAHHECQAELETILKAVGEGVIAINERNLIEIAGPELEAMWGYEPGELIGKPVQILQPLRYRRDHTWAVREFVKTDKADTSGRWNAVEGLHKQGHEFPIYIRIRRVQHSGRFLLVASVRDVSAFEAVKAHTQELLVQARTGIEPEALVSHLETLLEEIEAQQPEAVH